MPMFLVLIPFGLFGVLMWTLPAAAALILTAAAMAAIVGYDIRRGGTPKIFLIGAAVLFAAVGLADLAIGPLSRHTLRFAIDGGLFAIAVGSLAARVPFTIQFARETVEPAIVAMPAFALTNYILTGVWALAFALMLIGDILLVSLPDLPLWIGAAIAFTARNAAAFFTRWYPARRRASLALAPSVS